MSSPPAPKGVDLVGRTALVSGASAGIGRAIAQVLARKVGALVLVARRRDRLDALAAELVAAHPGLRVVVHAVDLCDRAATGALLDELAAKGEPIDVLVNNAGFGDYGRFDRAGWTKLERMLDLNVVAATLLVHRLVPGMVERGFGGVLNIGSSAGMLPSPGTAVYASTKAYVNHLSEALRAELVGTGVVVTVVCPGPVPTEFQDVAGLAARPSLPKILRVDVDSCAEQAVAALERGAPRVIPGLPMRAVVLGLEALPRIALRPMLDRVGRRLRR